MAQETILSLSLKEYKNEIESLRASLLGLARDSEEYQATAQQVRDMQDKLNQVMMDSKKDTAALEGSYNALTQELAQLRKEWKSTGDEARRNEIGKQMASISSQLKQLDASVGNFQRSVGNYEIVGQSLKSSLREQQEQLAQLLMQGYSPASEEVQRLVQETGRLKDAMNTAKGMTSQYANDLQGLSTVLDITKTATAGYGVFQSALSMFGIESEKTKERLQKLMAAQTMLNSLQQFSKALIDEESATYRVWNTVVQWVTKSKKEEKVSTDAVTASQVNENAATASSVKVTKAATTADKAATVQNNALATSEAAVGTATKGATAAMNGFKKALITTGIGALVVAIGYLIEKLNILDKIFPSLNKGQNDFNDSLQLTASAADAAKMSLDDLISKMIYQAALQQNLDKITSGVTNIVNAQQAKENAKKEYANADKSKTTRYYSVGGVVQSTEINNEEKARAKLNKTISDQNAIIKENETVVQEAYNIVNKASDLIGELDDKYKETNKSVNENTEATNDNVDAWDDEVEAINKNLRKLSEEIRYRKELRNAQGKSIKEQDLRDELELIGAQEDAYKKLITVYNKYINDAKTSDEDRDKLKKELIKTEEQLDKSKNDKEIANARLTTTKLDEEYKKRKDAFSSYMSYILDKWKKALFNNDFISDQVKTSSLPIVDMIVGDQGNYKLMVGDALAVLSGVREEIYNEFDKLVKKSDGKGGFNLGDLFFDDENGNQVIDYNSLALLRKYYQDIADETKAFTYEQSQEKRKAQQALYIIDEVIARENFDAQLSVYAKYIDELTKNRESLEEQFSNGVSSDSEYAKSERGQELTEDIQKLENDIANIKMEAARFVADYQIAQQKRVNDNAKEDAKEQKEYIESQVNAAADAAAAIGDLMQTVIDGRKQNLQSLYDEGKITEEELHKRFEDMKQAELATLWISTLAGATGAFLKDKETYPAPWNYIIGGIDFATTFAAGVAQHQAIKNQTWESASKGNGGRTSVSVSPLLNERLDMSTLSSINTEEIANNTSQDTRVYVLQQDLEDSANQVQVRESNTTF